MNNEQTDINDDLYDDEVCPECGQPLIEKWSGVKCSVCEYWFCY